MPVNIPSYGGTPREDTMADLSEESNAAKQKRWVKRYRTEVAASASSVLSTFAAVSLLSDGLSMTDLTVISFP
jgi:hypothetical protein